MGKKDMVITLEELEAALGKEHRGHSAPPEGWKTAKERASEWDVSLRTAQTRIADATEVNMGEMRKFRRKSIDGGTHYSAHYRFNLGQGRASRGSDPAP